jgi:hypothetical protein
MSEKILTPVEAFRETLSSQGVVVDPLIQSDLMSQVGYDFSTRADMVTLVRNIGHIINTFNPESMSNKPIVLDDDEDDPITLIIVDILNSSFEEPNSPPDKRIPSFGISDDTIEAGCKSAEPRFLEHLSYLESGDLPKKLKEKPAEVLVDDSFEPILFRKSIVELTGITLIPIKIGGWRLPPGTLVSMPSLKADGRHLKSGNGYEVYRYSYLANYLRIMRLTDFAFSPEVRRSYFRGEFSDVAVDEPDEYSPVDKPIVDDSSEVTLASISSRILDVISRD